MFNACNVKRLRAGYRNPACWRIIQEATHDDNVWAYTMMPQDDDACIVIFLLRSYKGLLKNRLSSDGKYTIKLRELLQRAQKQLSADMVLEEHPASGVGKLERMISQTLARGLYVDSQCSPIL